MTTMTLSESGLWLATQLRDALDPTPVVQTYVAPAPIDCCDNDCGTLVWWPGFIAPEVPDEPCPSRIVSELYFRLAWCWPTPDDQGRVDVAETSRVSACLIDALATMTKKLEELICARARPGLTFLEATSQRPSGGCASVTLKAQILVV